MKSTKYLNDKDTAFVLDKCGHMGFLDFTKVLKALNWRLVLVTKIAKNPKNNQKRGAGKRGK